MSRIHPGFARQRGRRRLARFRCCEDGRVLELANRAVMRLRVTGVDRMAVIKAEEDSAIGAEEKKSQELSPLRDLPF